MDAVLGDINIADPSANDVDMADITPGVVQGQEKMSKDKKDKKGKSKDKEDKKGKKDKKRRHSEVNGNAEAAEKKKHKRQSLD